MNRDNTFGQQVRQRRRAFDLTQDELARRVGCAAITLRKIEAGDARPSQQIAERLAMALAIPLDERAEFVRQARSVQPGDRAPEPTITPQIVPDEIGADDLSGRAIRTYTLHDKIGAGAFGVVYRAVQPLVEREVAIKIILPQYANHPDFIRRFEAEAQLVARLEHPHIVPLYDYWRDPGVAYLVMRLLRGGNVQDLLAQGMLPLESTSRIIDQIGAALHSAHRVGVVHRDLKPSNVLLDEEGNAYLADFGIAKNLGNPETQTQAGMVIGSPAYMSPEQINSEPIRPQADIYSLGVMLYELLTGIRPFLGPTPIDLIQQHLYATLPPLAANRSGLPEAFDQIIAHATAKDPSERYADVDQLLSDFHEVLQSGRLQATPLVPSLPIEIVNPYKGLRAFEEADAPDFFGREALTQQLLTRLGEGSDLHRFLAVIGPSGSGKSSVVKAGLLPALRRGALVGSENWFVITLTPGPHPLEELEAALLRIAVNPPESLLKQLREDERGLLRAINRTLPADDNIELVLIIDQFEEVFTLVQDEAERAHLLDSLVAATMAERSRVRVIITLRADFIDRPLRYVDFGELVQRRSELVLPLTPDEIERAIVGPAERVGLQLENGLAEAISVDVIDQPGALPLLQYALTEMYERRVDSMLTKAAYHDLGGVKGAVGRRAEEVFQTLDEPQQSLARQIFLRLVTLSEGTEDVRRRVLRSELESICNQQSALSTVLDAFGQARLLTFDRDLQTRGPTIEVAHEALLREWPRLREWLSESRADVRLQRLLANETSEWLKADRDASFLLRGSRLQQFEDWAQTTSIALTGDEQSYLRESLAERQRHEAEEEARQAHELKLERRALRFLQVLVGLAFVAAIIGGSLAITANLQRLRAEEAEVRAVNEAQVRATQQAVAEANFTRAEAQRLAAEANKLLISSGSVEQIALLAIRSMNLKYSAQGDTALVSAAQQNYPELLLQGHTDRVYGVAYSPDGQYLITGGQDGTARLWDVRTGKQVNRLDAQTTGVYSVAFSPDGQFVLTCGEDNNVRLWDVKTGQLVRTFTNATWVFTAVFSPDGKHMITADPDGHADVWDIQTGKITKEFIEQEALSSAVLSPDGKYLAASSYYGSGHLWDVETGKKLYTFSNNTSGANVVVFSPDGRYLLTANNDKTARLWDVPTGREVRTFLGHSAEVYAIAFSPDGRYVVTGGPDSTVRVWETQSGQQVRVFSAYTQGVQGVVFSPDGKSVATTGNDGLVRIWEVNPTPPLPEFNGHAATVRSVVFSPDGQYVLTGSDDQTACLWDARTGQPVRTFTGHDDQIWSAVFSPDGKQALTTSLDWTIRLWDVQTGKELKRFTPGDAYGRPTHVAFTPDGKHAVASYIGAVAVVWSLYTGRPTAILDEHTNGVFAVTVSPDGKYALTGSADRQAILWDLITSSEIRRLLGHTEEVDAAVFSPDGKYALTGSLDKTARVWDVQTGDELKRFVGHTAAIRSVAFSPDGKSVATGSLDGTVRIWDALTGQELRRFDAHTGVYSVEFSPDGQYLLAGLGDGSAKLWDVDYHTTMEYLCSRLQRDLTDEERQQYGITDTAPTCPQ